MKQRLFSCPRFIPFMIGALSMLCLTPLYSLQAQIPEPLIGRLIYIKDLASGDQSVVVASEQSPQAVNIPQVQKQCYSVSPLGNYLAISTTQADVLVIQSIATGNSIAQYPWSIEWSPCKFTFSDSDTILYIQNNQSALNVFTFDVLSGVIGSPTPEPILRTGEPPNRIPDDFILRSPNPDIVVYNRCTSGLTEVDMSGESACTSVPEFNIYSFSQDQTIETLTDMSTSGLESMEGLDKSQSWSPSGRYFIYLTHYNGNATQNPSLRVYDVVSRQYLTTAASTGYSVEHLSGFFWSPDESKVAFWSSVGILSSSLQLQLVIFNTQTESFLDYQTFEMDPNASRQLIWSPDSEAVAFLDVNQSLIKMDTGSGASVTIDSNVHTIVVWTA